ncbi:NAD-glutamate dehydrogenase [Wolbachia endosymbiont of Chironomus riparius]|uniref:NAD-glutamate dehydrogenase n=1 Tax=Wolbachia endosymbiont of Chironomus riparius TaxID=2883238 RepID=UPI00209D8CC8|nr:NAD-glutamate dehydrogenase domain-containing protein [Wolbachia endosymbiont of Chironomus riparius]
MCVDYNISNRVIDSLLNLVDQEENEKLKEFIKYFYNFVYNSSLKINNKFLLYIAKDAYDFILQKEKNESKFKVYSTKGIPGLEGNFTILKMVNDDMPFLVDSVIANIKSHGLTVCYYSNSIINVKRKNNLMYDILPLEEANDSIKESVIYIVIKGISNTFIDTLTQSLKTTLQAVTYCVKDWQLMLQKLNDVHNIEHNDFLNWLKNNNFVFLGYQECTAHNNGNLVVNDDASLGLFRVSKEYKNTNISSEKLSSLYVIRSHLISIVHRCTYMNCIGIKELDNQGKLIQEKRFFGLFTSVAEVQDIRTIPIVKDKIKIIEKRAGFVIGGHNNKALVSILQMFSCDELFQSNEDTLFEICISIMSLAIKPRVKLFLRNLGNFVSCIILIPMRYANSNLMFKIRDILKDEVNAKDSDIYNHHIINEYDLMKLHIILRVSSFNISDNEVLRIESKLRNITENWEDRFLDNLYNTFGTVEGIFIRYCSLFPMSYQEKFEPQDAYYDIKKLEIVKKKGSSEVNLKLLNNLNYQLKVYTPEKGGLELSKILKIIRNLGTKVLSHNGYNIKVGDGIWIHSFLLSPVDDLVNNIILKEQFELTLTKVFTREIKNDYFNSLIILAGLKWKEVLLIRALSAYLKQILFSYNQEYIQKVISEYPKIVKHLIQLFHARFDPKISIDRLKTTKIFKDKIEDFLREIDNVSHDYVLRSILNLIMSVVRTSYYQDDKSYLSMKLDSSKITNLPEPCPYRELYVYSSIFEGVHLRGGKLARGGLRWSDRTEDFRTEVLGLMKAQMTKNAIIVPVGAKGGFVIKHTYKDMKILREKGVLCYKDFIKGMLDITDNVVDGKVIPPENVVRYDEDDPYLVVAADKGTATFSDYANQIASEYNFWLGDAFASGGSAGYDHKKMGITARGAWIAAQRHFWRMNKDIHQNVTVVGIGDMSGDLFGNGMLLSKKIHLIGAFNHIHIFIDPNPDPEKSFAERQRLFELPFSNWMDYDTEVISPGGGIFERSNKYLNISQEMKKSFSIKEDKLSPSDVIKYLLKAKVDFIWNGGIGTFIKATSEDHSSAGDKANDMLRINGKDIRASMFIEGGNLGCTQLGRIEYADKGGYINADFIDNSAGVACSDLEVNIKIAFVSALKKKDISLEERNEILSSMIDEVTFKVLNSHNSIETKALVLEVMQAKDKLEEHHRLLLSLEKSGLLNRNIEFLPNDEEIMKMSKGFNSPQLSVLMSYTRTNIKNRIINSDLPEKDFLFDKYLLNYFPKRMVNEYKNYILKHQLCREIISTCISNEVVNRMGCVFMNNFVENTGIEVHEVTSIYILISNLYDLDKLWGEIEGLEKVVTINVYLEIVQNLQNFICRASFWLAKNFNKFGFSELIELMKFHDTIKNLNKDLTNALDERSLKDYNNELENLLKLDISEGLAREIAILGVSAFTLDILLIAEHTSVSVLEVSKVYFELNVLLKFDVIRKTALQVKNHLSYWERRAINDMLDDLSDCHYNFTIKVLKYKDKENLVVFWAQMNKKHIENYNSFLNEIIAYKFDVSRLISIIKRIKFLLYKENV